MAYFGRHAESFNASRTIKIPTTESVENYTVSDIRAKTFYVQHCPCHPFDFTFVYKHLKYTNKHRTKSTAPLSRLYAPILLLKVIYLKVYIIEVSIGANKWTVRHRYSEFHELHEKVKHLPCLPNK